MRKSISLLLLCVLFINANLMFAADKNELYKSIIEKYGSLKSISFSFKSAKVPSISGSIKAKKGNKYILNSFDRLITCDGKTIWNYSPKDKNVIITEYTDDMTNSSLEKLFFGTLTNMSPIELKEENSSKNGSSYVLKLAPKSNSNIKAITLWINKDKNDIKAIQIKTNESETKWILTNVKINSELSDKSFKFVVPKGAEVIDMR